MIMITDWRVKWYLSLSETSCCLAPLGFSQATNCYRVCCTSKCITFFTSFAKYNHPPICCFDTFCVMNIVLLLHTLLAERHVILFLKCHYWAACAEMLLISAWSYPAMWVNTHSLSKRICIFCCFIWFRPC